MLNVLFIFAFMEGNHIDADLESGVQRISTSFSDGIKYYTAILGIFESLSKGDSMKSWKSDRLILAGLCVMAELGLDYHKKEVAHRWLTDHGVFRSTVGVYSNCLTRLCGSRWIKRSYGKLLFNKLLIDSIKKDSFELKLRRSVG